MPVQAVQYCTLADLQNRLSDDGVNLRIDDKPTVITPILNRASTKVEMYCRPRYDQSHLSQSVYIQEVTATFAAYYLCQRRGNPPPMILTTDFEEAMNELRLIRKGVFNIPDVAMRKTDVPVLSQPRIRLDPFPRTVIEQNRSTGKPQGYEQFTDRLDFFDYSL